MAFGLSAAIASQDLTGKESEEKCANESLKIDSSKSERLLDIPECSITLEESQMHLRDSASTVAENQSEGHEQDIASSLNSSAANEGSAKELNSEGPSTSAENHTQEGGHEQDKNSLPRRASEERAKEVKCDGLDAGEKELRQQEENSSVMRRRIGVVEASDKVVAERMKTRVLRKRFGEGSVVCKMEGIFNKKL